MKKTRILTLVLVNSLLVGVFGACAPAGAPADAYGTAATTFTAEPPSPAPIQRGITLGLWIEPPNVAPGRHTSFLGHSMNALTHNGLFRLEYQNLVPTPDLIDSWIALSDTLFEFHITPGVMFHNGHELTAHDFAASFEYLRTYSYAIAVHGSIESARAIDNHTLHIDTGVPNAMLFYDLAHHGNWVLPRALIESGHDFKASPIGTGPFIFENWNLGRDITFIRNPYYFDDERSAHVPYVTWRFAIDAPIRAIALERGEMDLIVDVPVGDVQRMRNLPNVTVFERPGLYYHSMSMNTEVFPFDNIIVRQAVDMALDKEAMLAVSMNGIGTPMWQNTPFLPGSSSIGSGSFDPDGARALLDEHGLDPAALGFEILVNRYVQPRRRAEIAQANLLDIGIPTTITVLDPVTHLGATRAGAHQASFSGYAATNLMSFFKNTMHSSSIGAGNLSRINSPELDALIDKAIGTLDESERIAILEQAGALANEIRGSAPISMGTILRAHNSSLVLPEIGANGFMFLNMAYWIQ